MPDPFVIRWEIDEVSKLTSKWRYSPVHYHCNLPWCLLVGAINNRSQLALYLQCNDGNDCSLWSCERITTLSLIHRRNAEKSHSREIGKKYVLNKTDNDWGFAKLYDFTTLLNTSEGFIKNDKIIVEARTEVLSVNCIRKVPSIDLSQPNPDWDNISLKLGDGTVHVCRKFMMWHSPYFKSLLCSELSENNKDQIELEDVQTKEFTDLLHIILLPSRSLLNVDIFMHVLSLADRFQIELALDQVEKFLINTKNVDTSKKLMLSEQYRLESLKKHSLNSFKTPQDVKRLENSSSFSKLSVAIKVSLFAKVLELIK